MLIEYVVLERPAHEAGAGADAELLCCAFAVSGNRSFRDAKLSSNLLVGVTVGDPLRYLLSPLHEFGVVVRIDVREVAGKLAAA